MTEESNEMHPAGVMSGGRALATALAAHDVGPMMGMGGFQLLPFYEAIKDLGLSHYLINDERVGAFAADAYARVAGKPGVCDATLGPGATNLLTGLAESTNAGVPIIAITGDAHRQFAGRHMTQETRQVEMLRPATKELFRVESVSRIPEFVRRAYTVATSGRPGAVVLDIPEDVCHGVAEFESTDFWTDPRTHSFPSRRTRPDSSDVETATEILCGSERPVILAGGGVHLSDAYDALRRFADVLDAPVAHTISGKGSVGSREMRDIGVFGRYSRIANDLIREADCLISVGCKLGEIATSRYELIPGNAQLIHIDIDPTEAGRTTRPNSFLWGDIRLALNDLTESLGETYKRRNQYWSEIHARADEWRRKAAARLESDERPISVARLVHELNGAMDEDSILIADGGFAAHWTALLFDAKRAGRCYIADRGLASIGYGVPAALGASLAAPQRGVVAVTGDGGLNMSLGDLETLSRVQADVTLVVVNNAASGYVKALQHALFDGKFQSADLSEVAYASIAREFGGRGFEVTDPGELAVTLEEALYNSSGLRVVDVKVTRDPSKMLPGVDRRVVSHRPNDRIA